MTPATTKTLTIEDIRAPQFASGYRYVDIRPEADGRANRYRAQSLPRRPGDTGKWHGPRRATAEEAAQDYCDYINGGPSLPAKPTLKSAGHNGRRKGLPDDPEVEAALGVLRDAKGQAAGKQGFVYLIAETLHDGSVDLLRGFAKIGYSTNPQARVAELQTGNPRLLKLMSYFPGTEDDEKAMQQRWIHHNQLQEWFRLSATLLLDFNLKAKGLTP